MNNSAWRAIPQKAVEMCAICGGDIVSGQRRSDDRGTEHLLTLASWSALSRTLRSGAAPSTATPTTAAKIYSIFPEPGIYQPESGPPLAAQSQRGRKRCTCRPRVPTQRPVNSGRRIDQPGHLRLRVVRAGMSHTSDFPTAPVQGKECCFAYLEGQFTRMLSRMSQSPMRQRHSEFRLC